MFVGEQPRAKILSRSLLLFACDRKVPPYPRLGLASVGNDAVKHASRYVSYRPPGYRHFSPSFLCLAVTEMLVELDHVVQIGEPTPHKGDYTT